MPDDVQNNPEQGGKNPEVHPQNAAQPEQVPLKETRNEMSDRLGELEVQRVEASDELEKIRNQSANQVQNQTEVLEGEESAAFQDDGSGLKELMREANLSPKHLKFCCGAVVGVALLIALIFGALRFVNWMGDRPEREPKPDEEVLEEGETPAEEEVQDDDGVPFVEIGPEYDYEDVSISMGIYFGQLIQEEDPALDAGGLLGEELVDGDSLAQAISAFAEVYEALQVDVKRMLDQSTQRRETLEDYVNELKYLKNRGESELGRLEARTEGLSQQFLDVEDEKDLFESRFFDRLSNLDAYGASSALNEFIIRGEEVVNLRAQYLAREKLISYYEVVLQDLERRILDIEVNEEALVKGVQVVEIEGSDIDLIIQEDEL